MGNPYRDTELSQEAKLENVHLGERQHGHVFDNTAMLWGITCFHGFCNLIGWLIAGISRIPRSPFSTWLGSSPTGDGPVITHSHCTDYTALMRAKRPQSLSQQIPQTVWVKITQTSDWSDNVIFIWKGRQNCWRDVIGYPILSFSPLHAHNQSRERLLGLHNYYYYYYCYKINCWFR